MEGTHNAEGVFLGPAAFVRQLLAGASLGQLAECLAEWVGQARPEAALGIARFRPAFGRMQLLAERGLTPELLRAVEDMPLEARLAAGQAGNPQQIELPAEVAAAVEAAALGQAHLQLVLGPEGALRGAFLVASRQPEAQLPPWLIEGIQNCALLALGRDVRDQAARQSEQRFRSVFDQAAVGMWQVDRQTRLTMANDRFAEIIGYSPGSLVGLPIAELVDPRDRSHQVSDLEDLFRGEIASFAAEYRYRHHNGRSVWLRTTISAVCDEDEQVLYAIGVLEDVSDRKQAELRQRFLSQLNDAIRSYRDPKDIMTTAAHLAGRYTGVSRAGYVEIDGESGVAVALSEYRVGVVSMLGTWALEQVSAPLALDALVRGETVVIDDTYAEPGTAVRRELYERTDTRAVVAVPLVKNGRLVAAFVLHDNRVRHWTRTDVELTEEVAERTWLAVENERTRAALRASEQKYKSLVENASEGIAVLDCDGFRVLEANEAMRRMFKLEPEQMHWIDWRDTVPESQPEGRPSAEVITDCIARALAGEVVVRESVHKDMAGREFPCEVRLTNLPDPHGRPLVRATITDITDITERKRAEQALEALNETLEQRVAERTAVAEERTAQLRALAAQLADVEQRERRRIAEILHDHLQQLLVAGKLRVNFLRNRFDDPALLAVLDELRDLLDQSVDASRSLTVELSPPILYDAGLVPALEWLARWVREKNHLEVTISAEAELEPLPEDIRGFLFQAVRELLFNVVKHAGVNQANVRLARTLNHDLLVTVSDAGAGFCPEAAARQRKEDGGFGLFSIRERVEMLGGSFSVDALPGAGTRIQLQIPVGRTGGAKPRDELGERPANRQLSIPLGRIRVLLADDHRILREGLAELLQDEGDIELVGEASDGAMAVELAAELEPDVVVMDVGMPRLNGIEATRRIVHACPQVRVIGLSMHDQEDMAAAMREAGACEFITKGGPAELLLAAIRGVACRCG